MSGDDRCFVCACIGHFDHQCPDAQCYGCDELGHFAQDYSNKFPTSGMWCHKDRSHSRHWYTHNQRTDHTPIMVPDIGDIWGDHSSTAIPTMTEAVVLEGTPYTPPPTTPAACISLQLIDTLITPHAMVSMGIVTPHPALTTSPTDVTHTTPLARASLTPATPTSQHRNLSPQKQIVPKISTPNKSHLSKTVTIWHFPLDSSSDGWWVSKVDAFTHI